MPYYRVDKRDYEVGDRIMTAGEYVRLFTEEQRSIEGFLEESRPPEKPPREGSLFLFEDLGVARKHWSKMKQGKLYEVETPTSVLHRGDMQLTEHLWKALQAGKSTQDLCAGYWRGDMTEKPEVEVLVAEAIVRAVISKDDGERHRHLMGRSGMTHE